MKFLLELGSCYRSSSTRTQNHVKRSTHERSSKSGSGHQWRPALVAISEDGVVSGHEGNVQSKKMTSAKGRRPRAKVPSFGYTTSDDFQHYSRKNDGPTMESEECPLPVPWAWGVVARDSNGSLVAGSAKKGTAISPLESEARAAHLAVEGEALGFKGADLQSQGRH
ncbi:hypothetical protein DVH24_032290 [Malus domestica]|uniref:Uncharacterized protein n=1 Tax=Malus domestica TaxID=3750 RepID=A0A498J7Z6_MALDO|nr:hypothetical protein DVH24_032290 [Malus domestica]